MIFSDWPTSGALSISVMDTEDGLCWWQILYIEKVTSKTEKVNDIMMLPQTFKRCPS